MTTWARTLNILTKLIAKLLRMYVENLETLLDRCGIIHNVNEV